MRYITKIMWLFRVSIKVEYVVYNNTTLSADTTKWDEIVAWHEIEETNVTSASKGRLTLPQWSREEGQNPEKICQIYCACKYLTCSQTVHMLHLQSKFGCNWTSTLETEKKIYKFFSKKLYKFYIFHLTWPQMTLDLETWSLTSFTYKWTPVASLTQVWFQWDFTFSKETQIMKANIFHLTWPQMTLDLGMWHLTSLAYEGALLHLWPKFDIKLDGLSMIHKDIGWAWALKDIVQSCRLSMISLKLTARLVSLCIVWKIHPILSLLCFRIFANKSKFTFNMLPCN